MTNPLNTDVLIIGAGAAGLTAALTAHDAAQQSPSSKKGRDWVAPPPFQGALFGCQIIHR